MPTKAAANSVWSDIVELSDGILAGLIPNAKHKILISVIFALSRFLRTKFREVFADRGYLLCELHRGVDDTEYVKRLRKLSLGNDVPLVAAGDVHYHTADRMLMHDCVTAIRHGTTIDKVHQDRFANSQRHLRSLAEIANLYRRRPGCD